LRKKWKVSDVPSVINSPYKLLIAHQLKNVFIFGEDPIGCAINRPEVETWFEKLDFVVVQDYFLTETAKTANLVLPASLPFEIGGSFTNTQKHIIKFEKEMESATEKTSPQQLIDLMGKFGVNGISDMEGALWEAFTLFPPATNPENKKYRLHFTEHDNFNRMFGHGCDIVNKRFDDEFENAFK